MTEIANSRYVDMVGYGLTTASTAEAAFSLQPGRTVPVTDGQGTVTVALTLNRANDPAALLNQDWAQRQAAIAAMQADGTLWTTYGAPATAYAAANAALAGLGLQPLPDGNGRVSSAASRTVWLTLTASQFGTLFGTALLANGGDPGLRFWNGTLSLPPSLAGLVSGISVEAGTIIPTVERDGTAGVVLRQGPQSPGNDSSAAARLYPNQVSDGIYHFPLPTGATLPTGSIGLIETGIGDDVAGSGASFQQLLDEYRAAAGIAGRGTYYVDAPQNATVASSGERSLDVGIVTAVAPNSTMGLYIGGKNPSGSNFSAYLSAIWDTRNNPASLSSSFSDGSSASPDSPFYRAYNALFVDAALRNISVFLASGDGGSQEKYGTGQPMAEQSHASAYAVVVGGTSVSTQASAAADPTLAELVAAAAALDPSTLRRLIAGGLRDLPTAATAGSLLTEAVWNQYVVKGTAIASRGYDGQAGSPQNGFATSLAGSGGVDVTQTIPGYQAEFGLRPTRAGADPSTGRGLPDVSALSGGNMSYTVPQPLMAGVQQNGGTSASAPLWAALTAQIQGIFADQGLPTTGYFNDLLYAAAALAPASFNDVTLGNNDSTYVRDAAGTYTTGVGKPSQAVPVTATGLGYAAGPGYDLTTGLGTPNGTLLARALTTIAHGQTHSAVPGVLTAGRTASVDQTLGLQLTLRNGGTGVVTAGSVTTAASAGPGAGAMTWSNQFAQQVLQADFDADLVRVFDQGAQAAPTQLSAKAGDTMTVVLDGAAAHLTRDALTSPFGILDYATDSGDRAVLARPVAVATTAGGADNQDAIVRMRQMGADTVRMSFYRVDDLTGTIGGIAPGSPGYAVAALDRSYYTAGGTSSIEGPGMTRYGEARLLGVNSGDLVAATLTDVTTGIRYWAFDPANEAVGGKGVTHLWNYGLNSWGWEDGFAGGDRDYNDLTFQLDFTSASGSKVLA